MNRHWGFSYGFRYVPIYRRPIDKWAQAQFGIIDNLICRDFGSTPGDTYCLIYNGYFQKLDLKGFLTAPTPRPSIGQPSMDGHWSALPFWNMAWFTISVANYATRGGSKIPNKSIINNPKLRLCPFIARPPMDGYRGSFLFQILLFMYSYHHVF